MVQNVQPPQILPDTPFLRDPVRVTPQPSVSPEPGDTGSEAVIVDVRREGQGKGRFDDALRFNGAQGRGFAFGKVKQAERAADEAAQAVADQAATPEPPGDDPGAAVDPLVTTPEAAADPAASQPIEPGDTGTATVNINYADALAALDLLSGEGDAADSIDLLA